MYVTKILVNEEWFEEKHSVNVCIYVAHPSLEV